MTCEPLSNRVNAPCQACRRYPATHLVEPGLLLFCASCCPCAVHEDLHHHPAELLIEAAKRVYGGGGK